MEQEAPTARGAINEQEGPSVTVCIVTHNDAELIAGAIASVIEWAREVVVLDCESTDASADIARSMGAAVYSHTNGLPDANKNYCFEHATSEWIMIIDPDEVLPAASKDEIDAVLARRPQENGFQMPRRNHYFGVPLMHGGMYPNTQVRLFRRGRGRYPGVGSHERLILDGALGRLNEPFDHHPYPTFEVWLRKFDFYTRMGAALLAERGMPITSRTIRQQMVTRPLRRWVERLVLKRGFRDGAPGVFAASADFATNVGSFMRYWISLRKKQ